MRLLVGVAMQVGSISMHATGTGVQVPISEAYASWVCLVLSTIYSWELGVVGKGREEGRDLGDADAGRETFFKHFLFFLSVAIGVHRDG